MIKFCYNNGDIFRSEQFDIATLTFSDRANTVVKPFKEECIARAISIWGQSQDMFLALSGGMSSQMCLESFIEAGIKPKIMIIKFPNAGNNYDVNPAIASCVKYGIVPLVIEVQPLYTWDTIGPDLVDEYQIYNTFDLLIANISQQLKAQILLVDRINIRRDVDPKKNWSLIYNEGDFWTQRYNSVNRNQQLIIDNFYSASQLITGFLEIPIIRETVQGLHKGKISIQSSKKEALGWAGFSNATECRFTDSTYYLTKVRDKLNEHVFKTRFFENRKFYIPVADYLNNKGKTTWQFI